MLKKLKDFNKSKNTDLKKNSFISKIKSFALKNKKTTCIIQNFQKIKEFLKSKNLKKN